MLLRLLFRHLSERNDPPADPLARLTPRELADLPPWHPVKAD